MRACGSVMWAPQASQSRGNIVLPTITNPRASAVWISLGSMRNESSSG